MKHIKLFESWGVEQPLMGKNIQSLPDSEVMPKVAEIAKEMNIYLVPHIMEFKVFTQKVYSLNGNFNIEGVDYSAIIAHVGLPSSVQLFCYSKLDTPNSFKLIENFYEVLKKEFPSIKFKDFHADRTDSEGNYNFNGNTVEIGGAKIWDFTKEI